MSDTMEVAKTKDTKSTSSQQLPRKTSQYTAGVKASKPRKKG
jgi:hypothetical protein